MSSETPPVSAERPPLSKRDARRQNKSDLAAAKARSKASRPFWKKPWVWLLAIVLVVILAVVANAASGSSPTNAGQSNGSTGNQSSGQGGGGGQSGSSQSSATGIGKPASDGQFTFTVQKFTCGATKIGNGMLAVKAQGQFCVANMTVKNTGNTASTLDSSSQYAYIGDKQYTASSDVVMATPQAQAFFLQNINPGNSVQGIVVWDVPKGAKPDRLELHDSMFSGGVTVQVG
jgi:hypothetical protein